MDQLTNGDPQIAALAKAVRKRADYLSEEVYTQQEDISGNLFRLARDVAELGRVLANLIEGKSLDRAFGAPGDWGYDHPIGRALAACYAAHATAKDQLASTPCAEGERGTANQEGGA